MNEQIEIQINAHYIFGHPGYNYKEWIPSGLIVNKYYYKDVLISLR